MGFYYNRGQRTLCVRGASDMNVGCFWLVLPLINVRDSALCTGSSGNKNLERPPWMAWSVEPEPNTKMAMFLACGHHQGEGCMNVPRGRGWVCLAFWTNFEGHYRAILVMVV